MRFGFEAMNHLLPFLLAALATSSCVVNNPTGQSSASMNEDETPSKPWLHPFLPDNLEPVEYSLYQFPDLYFDGAVFTGHVAIRMKVRNETDTIIVHIKSLNVTATEVLDEKGNQLILTDTFEHKPNEYWVVKTRDPLPDGTEATMKMNFTGALINDGIGFYKSTYINDITGKKSWLAATLFQLNEARKAFPCFDEPRFKALFTITLRHWRNFTGVSNMPLQRYVLKDDVWQESTFMRTPLMSTYLVAFIVSDFEYKYNLLSDGKQNRMWVRPDHLKRVTYALNISKIISDFFAVDMAEPYTLPKQDHFAVPGMLAAGLEQWGLITYSDSFLLPHPDYETADRKQQTVSLVAHELAHNYFGNLVTCRDWSELWLNEGLGSFYEYRGAAAAEPTMFYDGQFFSRYIQPLMMLDAVNNSRPVVIKLKTPKSYFDASDIIGVDKAMAVLTMIENIHGPAAFKRGIRRFIRDNKYKTVVTHDFLASFVEDVSIPHLENVMSNWIYKMGYPVVTIVSAANESSMTTTQKRFLLDPTSDIQSPPVENGYWWHIPIRYRTQGGQDGFFWLADRSRSVLNPVKSEGGWILLNYDHCGYYVVNYNLELWNRLKQQLKENHKIFAELERSKLLSDALSVARAEQLNYSVALDMTEYMQRETGLLPWDTFAFGFRYINSKLFGSKEYGVFQNYVRDLTTNIMNELGVQDGGSHVDKLLRSKIIRLSCSNGHEGCLSKMTHLFRAWIEDEVANVVPVNLRRDVYYEGISSSSLESDWHTVWKRYAVATLDHDKENLLYALSATKNIDLIESLLEYSMNESQFRSQDFFFAISSLSANLVANDHVWQWLQGNYKQIVNRFGDAMIGGILLEVVYNFNTGSKRQEVLDFFENHYPEGDAKYRTEALRTIDTNIRWMERCLPDVARWLVRNE